MDRREDLRQAVRVEDRAEARRIEVATPYWLVENAVADALVALQRAAWRAHEAEVRRQVLAVASRAQRLQLRLLAQAAKAEAAVQREVG
jgi:hypothetical protein